MVYPHWNDFEWQEPLRYPLRPITTGYSTTTVTLTTEDKMKFRNDVERKAWADYINAIMSINCGDETAGERRAKLVKVCEEADWLIEEMRRRA